MPPTYASYKRHSSATTRVVPLHYQQHVWSQPVNKWRKTTSIWKKKFQLFLAALFKCNYGCALTNQLQGTWTCFSHLAIILQQMLWHWTQPLSVSHSWDFVQRCPKGYRDYYPWAATQRAALSSPNSSFWQNSDLVAFSSYFLILFNTWWPVFFYKNLPLLV